MKFCSFLSGSQKKLCGNFGVRQPKSYRRGWGQSAAFFPANSRFHPGSWTLPNPRNFIPQKIILQICPESSQSLFILVFLFFPPSFLLPRLKWGKIYFSFQHLQPKKNARILLQPDVAPPPKLCGERFPAGNRGDGRTGVGGGLGRPSGGTVGESLCPRTWWQCLGPPGTGSD